MSRELKESKNVFYAAWSFYSDGESDMWAFETTDERDAWFLDYLVNVMAEADLFINSNDLTLNNIIERAQDEFSGNTYLTSTEYVYTYQNNVDRLGKAVKNAREEKTF